MSKVVVYLRVSTENQEAEGISLETQERACLAKAHELAGPGDEVIVLREVYSGLSLDRPELSRLREWVRAGQAKAVVVYSADRLARDGLHLLLLVEEMEKAGATLAFVTEPHQSTPEGQLLTFVRGWASKLEALKIKERTVRGRKERARRGQLPTGVSLYGYLYMKGKGESRGIRIPDPEKAKVVASIFNWYVNEGMSLRALSVRLHALAILSPMGMATWKVSSLRALLRNPAYIGRTVSTWGAEEIESPNATPAIVDTAIWGVAQERLRLNRENSRRNGRRDYPLRGLLFCGTCGARLTGMAKGKTGHSIRYYRCWRHLDGDKHSCFIRADRLEAEVWAALHRVLADPELVRSQVETYRHHSGGADLESRLAQIEARLKALAQGEGAIARQLRQGLLSEATATQELRQGQRDRATLERDKAAILGQVEAARIWERLDLEALCARAVKALDTPTPETKRLALEALNARVTVTGRAAQVSLNLPLEAPQSSSFVLRPS